eukprot:symbB.v1.2.014262.t1/scaffold1023.1/size143418/6
MRIFVGHVVLALAVVNGLEECEDKTGNNLLQSHARRVEPKYFWQSGRGNFPDFGVSQDVGPFFLNQTLKWSWHHPAGRFHTLTWGTAIDHQMNIYLAAADGLRKFDKDGKLLWEVNVLPANLMNAPAIYQGSVFSSDTQGGIHAVDMATGKHVWFTNLSKPIGQDNGFTMVHEGVVLSAGDHRWPSPMGAANHVVLSITGECMLTLNVADSMLGRELWKSICDKLSFKPGQQLVLSHNTLKLVLHESLQQQGFRSGSRAQVSATFVPVNLLAACLFAHGCNVEDEEFALNGITEVTEVSHSYCHAMRALLHNLPNSLRTLTFGPGFNRGLHDVRLPLGLQSVTFGGCFNRNLDNVTWPAGLQSLTFGQNFDQKLDSVTWPAGLQSLTFGFCFNQSLDNVTWPASLQSLTFGQGFDQKLDNLTWPAGLRCLTFGRDFNQSLDNLTWPAGLQSLTFGCFFNQNLDNVTWPAGLRTLTFGTGFNQSLDKVTLPAGLQTLAFGECFNQNLDNATWPAGLQSLAFQGKFNQSLDNVAWPADLQSLTFGRN